MDHSEIQMFSKKHNSVVKKRSRKRFTIEKSLNLKDKRLHIKDKIQKVNEDKYNYFLTYSSQGNNSIMGQSTHPAKKKKILDMKKKEKEFNLKLKRLRLSPLASIFHRLWAYENPSFPVVTCREKRPL